MRIGVESGSGSNRWPPEHPSAHERARVCQPLILPRLLCKPFCVNAPLRSHIGSLLAYRDAVGMLSTRCLGYASDTVTRASQQKREY